MYYKIENGTESYEKLKVVFERINEVNQIARKAVENEGFKKFCPDRWSVAGGVDAVYSETKPEGYKQVGKKYQCLYYPRANNKEVLARFKKLPLLSFDEMNSTIGFKDQFKGLRHFRTFGVIKLDRELEQHNLFIIKIDDRCDFEPPKDLIEILRSEYNKLKEEFRENKS